MKTASGFGAWQRVGMYLLLVQLISLKFPGPVQAQQLRIQRVETGLTGQVATGSPAGRLEEATVFNTQLPVDVRAAEGSMTGTPGLFSQLSQLEPPIDSTDVPMNNIETHYVELQRGSNAQDVGLSAYSSEHLTSYLQPSIAWQSVAAQSQTGASPTLPRWSGKHLS